MNCEPTLEILGLYGDLFYQSTPSYSKFKQITA